MCVCVCVRVYWRYPTVISKSNLGFKVPVFTSVYMFMSEIFNRALNVDSRFKKTLIFIQRDKTKADTLMYIPNDDTQNNPSVDNN